MPDPVMTRRRRRDVTVGDARACSSPPANLNPNPNRNPNPNAHAAPHRTASHRRAWRSSVLGQEAGGVLGGIAQAVRGIP